MARIRLLGPNAKLIDGRHVAPGEVVDAPDHVARYFTSQGWAESATASPDDADGPAVEHRDPKVRKR